MSDTEVQMPFAQANLSRLEKIIEQQNELIQQIQSKCHVIYNLNEPVAQKAAEEVKTVDFISILAYSMDRLAYNNNKLETIYQHLSKVF